MYTWIDNTVVGLKESYNAYSIYDLYDLLKIRIVKLEPNNILLRGNESVYYRDFMNDEIVFIRNDLNRCLEKFILAHELGHAILHTNLYVAAFNKNIGKCERQANYFAFKLLDIELDPVEFEGFNLEQIASSLYLTKKCFYF